MGTFYVACTVANHVNRKRTTRVPKLLVDAGSDYTWIPQAALKRIGAKDEKKDLAFVMANGQTVTRTVGFAIVRVNGQSTIDEVVFAHKGDLLLLGARTLEGLNLRVDAKRKKLVAGGPLTAA
jgi:predicted aspartyl protease